MHSRPVSPRKREVAVQGGVPYDLGSACRRALPCSPPSRPPPPSPARLAPPRPAPRRSRPGSAYDAYYADPSVGATTGGTHVTLIGRGTHWTTGTTATIDGKACTELAVDDETHLRCLAPKGTPGTKSITVTTPDAVVSTAR